MSKILSPAKAVGDHLRFDLLLTLCLIVNTTVLAQARLDLASFGAVGDAEQLHVNTTSNSAIVTTSVPVSTQAVGKVMQVFGVGPVTVAPRCEDLVATITGVRDGTNVFLSDIARRTLSNTFATFGQDNRVAFQRAVDAASGPETVIEIPAGKFLILPAFNPKVFGNAGVTITKGGLRFVGKGIEETVLISQGAWRRQDGAACRGFLFAIVPPITNDFPLSFENLTLDGGVPDGLTQDHSFPASVVTGAGWDETHGAIVVRGGAWQVPTVTHQTWTNLLFRHWRGEMVKSNDGSTNGNLNILNCRFVDGNATAINIYASLNVSNCVFDRLFQVGEYYMAYSTNSSRFQNNLITNIAANGFALNGATGRNPQFTIRSNIWYLPQGGYNGIMTTPGYDVAILDNRFIGRGGGCFVVVLGAAGYQGTYHNKKIVVSGNTFENVDQGVQISGALDATGANRVEDVLVSNNHFTGTTTPSIVVAHNWSSNVVVASNTVDSLADRSNGDRIARVSTGANQSPFALVAINNLYYTPVYDLTGKVNYLSYGQGSRFQIVYPFYSSTKYALVTTNANQIPRDAQILVQNDNMSGVSVPIYLDSNLSKGPVQVMHGKAVLFSWTNGAWTQVSDPLPPGNLHVLPAL